MAAKKQSGKTPCLVIVESPTKVKSLTKYLDGHPDKTFTIMASVGHVRDLEPKTGAVDPANGFAMRYRLIERSQKQVNDIVRAAKKADTILLATDPDREGEAIAWHLCEILTERGVLPKKEVARVVFHEITNKAINHAIDHPRELAMPLVNAQQARRALDFLVGFTLSPLLWKKIQRGLSAGRVQSPALRLITERELEIEQFDKKEYWSVEAEVSHKEMSFQAKLSHFEGEKLKQFSITDEKRASAVQASLKEHAKNQLTVEKVEKKDRKRQPAAPFITSTLQQEAARKLGFTAKRTMRVAQQLYEGIDTGDGNTGLITYMRTDSVSLSQEALQDIRGFIAKHYGKDQHPSQPRAYKTKAKNAQEAHEAIRPTSAFCEPSSIKGTLSDEQYKLYLLIWRRTVASQMIPATILQVAADINCGPGNTFRATGSTIKDPGFLQVYEEGQDESNKAKHLPMEQKLLPPMSEGDKIDANDINALQHFTEPPPRFSEASLIKALEEYGIGRPSTYASIIDTIQQRGYVEIDQKRFTPTDIGRIVNGFLTEHFTRYVDYGFTAKLEDQLDQIAQGKVDWIAVLDDFWQPFNTLIKDKAESVSREQVVQQRELGTDPKTGKPICVRMGRFGPFVQLGHKDDEEKPQFAGLPDGLKMHEVDLAKALKLLTLPRQLGTMPNGDEISVNIGRYGPYVRYGKFYVSLGEQDPYTVNLEQAQQLIAEHQVEQKKRILQSFEGSKLQVLKGPYGPYITDGKKNAKVPKGTEPSELSLAESQELLAKAPASKGWRGRGRKGAKKTK